MTPSTVIVAHGFQREHALLQPWRYVYELAVRMSAVRPVYVITDGVGGTDREEWQANFTVIRSETLAAGRREALVELINSLAPTEIWWSATPRSIVYSQAWKNLACRVTALVTCPLYPWSLLLRALWLGVPYRELRALLQQRLVPRWTFGALLNGRQVSHVVTQSESNRKLLVAAGVTAEKVSVIPVGIGEEDRAAVPDELVRTMRARFDLPEGAVLFLYLGAVRAIRGIYALLEAFRLAAADSPNAYLGVLARGADERLCDEVRARCVRLGIADRVRVLGGWLERDRVWAGIEASDVVVLPFVVVPSDVPIAVLEAMVRGKPVIASPIDGIPELVRGRGVLVDPLDRQALAHAIVTLAGDGAQRASLGAAAQHFMQYHPDWDQAGEMALALESSRRSVLKECENA